MADGGGKTSLEKPAGLEDSNVEQRKGKGLLDNLVGSKNRSPTLTPLWPVTATLLKSFTTSMLKCVKLCLGAIAGPITFDMENVTGVHYQYLMAPMEFTPATHAITD